MRFFFVERIDSDGVSVLVAVRATIEEAVQAMEEHALGFANRMFLETHRIPSAAKMSITPYPSRLKV